MMISRSSSPKPGRLARKPVIHVIDDDESFRTAIARVLDSSGYHVIPYPSADIALNYLPKADTGVILLDVQMPGLSGPELQEQLMELGCAMPVVFMTGHGDIPTSVRAMRAGAEDFLSKPVQAETLLSTIARAVQRLDEEQQQRSKQKALQSRFDSLSPREKEVFELAVRGKMNKQIGFQLGVTIRTVKAHRQKITTKLAVRSIAELVSFAENLHIGAREKPHLATARNAVPARASRLERQRQ